MSTQYLNHDPFLGHIYWHNDDGNYVLDVSCPLCGSFRWNTGWKGEVWVCDHCGGTTLNIVMADLFQYCETCDAETNNEDV